MNPVLKNFVRVIVFVSFLSLWHLAAAQDTLLSVTQKKQLQGQQRAQTIEDKVKELSVQLNLTNKQSQRITEILKRAKDQTSRLIEEVADKIRAVKKKSEDEIQAVMTKEQWVQYKPSAAEEEEGDEDTILKVFGESN